MPDKSAFQKVVEEANKSLEDSKLQRTSPSDISGFISTGNYLLDKALRGGIPRGKIVEVFGKESSGKTTLASQIIANVQENDGIAVVLDSEASLTQDSVERVGGNYDEIVRQESPIVEHGFEVMRSFLESFDEEFPDDKPPAVFIWDTLAASPAKATWEDNAGMAQKARVLSEEFTKITTPLAEQEVSLVLLNQTRTSFGRYGTSQTAPGGKAVKFYCSARIMLDEGKPENIKKDGQVVGQTTNFKLVKLKYGPGGAWFRVPLLYDSGYHDYQAMLWWLKKDDRAGPLDEGKSGVYQNGAWLKLDLPSGTESLYSSEFFDLLEDEDKGDEVKEFLRDRVEAMWDEVDTT